MTNLLEKTILNLYRKQKFTNEENDFINNAIENKEIYTEDIKEDFIGYAYKKIKDKYSAEEIWEYTDDNYQNGLTHIQNYKNLIDFLNTK